MQEQEILIQHFDTQLPYLRMDDESSPNDSVYQQFLYDSINPPPINEKFIFELKEIEIPESDSASIHVIKEVPSIFFPYKTQPTIINHRVRQVQQYDWLTLLLILCLGILVWVKYEGGRRISQIFKAVGARHNMNQLFREGDIIRERITPGLMFNYLITFTTLVFLLIRPFDIEIPGAESSFLQFSILAGVIFILWILKLTVIRLSGIVFKTRNDTNEYLITNIIFILVTGLVALPFVFSAHYSNNDIILWVSAAIFGLGLIMKFIRSVFVGLTMQTFPVFYIFLYLCTLEILPLLIMCKLIVSV